MLLFILKLLVTPMLIGLVSLIGRRWGPAVSGWFVGLPLTSGPVVLYLALEQGTVFAAGAAQGTMLGLISVAGFCLAYSWLSFRFRWPICIVVSWGVFFLLTFLLEREQFQLSLLFAFVVVVVCLLLTLKLLPATEHSVVFKQSPRWEMLLRMLVATAFVLVLTGAASLLGPQLSGLLTPFPIYATILAVFTHHFQDGAATRALLRGVVTGVFSFAAFFLIVSALILPWGILVAFSLAIGVALLMHSGSLFLLSRHA